jgi:hypothetical protein
VNVSPDPRERWARVIAILLAAETAKPAHDDEAQTAADLEDDHVIPMTESHSSDARPS